MIAYHNVGENAILNNSPSGEASQNGDSQWGIHNMTQSYPFGFDNISEVISDDNDFKTVLNEYLHVIQKVKVYSLEREIRNEILKPNEIIWMMEGVAEYMANYTLFKLINNGTLSIEIKTYRSLRDNLFRKMERVKEDFQ